MQLDRKILLRNRGWACTMKSMLEITIILNFFEDHALSGISLPLTK